MRVFIMDYNFSFKEVNYGSIKITSDHIPSNAEVEEAIMNGEGFYKNTEYSDINLDEQEPTKVKNQHDHER